jgi:hypothetical protein
MALAAAASSRVEAREYPVYSSAPLYLRESLLFPYTDGLLFQQAVVEKLGTDAFRAVFRNPPISTQHILHPETYFDGVRPAKPALPALGRIRGFKDVAEGQVGELDHQILLKQYLGEDQARALGPAWRGGRYALRENKAQGGAILLYASQWESPLRAREFFKAYLEVCRKKWAAVEIETQTDTEMRGRGDDGFFLIRLNGVTVQSIEGLPERPPEPM